MSVFRILSIEEMQEMTDEDLVDYALVADGLKKDFIVKKNDLLELKNEKGESIGEDFRHEFGIDLEDNRIKVGFDFSEMENGKVKFPYFDERRVDIYEKEFLGVRMLPPKSFYWLVDTDVERSPLGIIRTETHISKVDRKFSDFRFPNVIRLRNTGGKKHVNEKFFYFDFTNEVYVQVNKEKTINPKTGETDNPETQTLLDQEEMVRYIRTRFSKAIEEYRMFFAKYHHKITALSSDLTTTTNFTDFFGAYEELLSLAVDNLPIKQVIGHIDIDERLKLEKEISEFEDLMTNARNKIEEVLIKEKVEELSFNSDAYKKTYSNLYIYVLGNKSSGLIEKLMDFITKRPELNETGVKPLTGYIEEVASSKKIVRLYPNLATIETRDFYSNEQSSQDNVQEYERELLNNINAGFKQKEQEKKVLPFVVQRMSELELDMVKESYRRNDLITIKSIVSRILKREKEIESSKYEIYFDSLCEYLSAKL